MIIDKGLWYIGQNHLFDKRVFIESDDFTHDVRLYIDGDFIDDTQKLEYACGIAHALNSFLKLKESQEHGQGD